MFLWQFTLMVYSVNHALNNSDRGAANICREKARALLNDVVRSSK